jgi:small ligand-binding sensory domain FIST
MSRFHHSLAVDGDWLDLCRRALDALGPMPNPGSLGFVYVTDALTGDVGAIADYLAQQSGVDHWVGSVASGVIGNGREVYDKPAVSVLVTDLAPEAFRLVPTQKKDVSPFLAETADWRHANLAFFAVVHGDPRNGGLPHLLNRFSQGLEGGFLVGGLSSGSDENFVQIVDGETTAGLSGVLFSGQVPVVTGVTQGCSLIGRRHEVTACEGNLLQQLDGRPALEVFLQDIGPDLADDLNQVGGLIFAALPVPGSDTGDYLVRNLMAIDRDRGMLAIGDLLEEGMNLQFARRDADTATTDLRRMLRSVRQRSGDRAKGALYFSCLGRGRHLFGEDSAELKIVREELGDIPLAGFYANGEISHNRLYGYTGVLTVFTD